MNLNALPNKSPLLPLLEELQIEGAKVLPEITQSLENTNLTLSKINLAGVSLNPTPTKLVQISTDMTDASKAVTRKLDRL